MTAGGTKDAGHRSGRAGYRITDLGTLPGGAFSVACAVDAAGRVLGGSQDGTVWQAVWWDDGDRIHLLDAVPGYESSVNAVSPSGLAAGWLRTGKIYRPARWDRAGQLTELALPDGDTFGYSSDINDLGVVAGTTGTDSTSHAVRWDAHGRPAVLRRLPDALASFATGVNDHGTLVGEAVTAAGSYRAVRWDDAGRATELAGLPGAGGSSATTVNEHGTVIGAAMFPGRSVPVRWDGRAAPVPVPVPEDSTHAGVSGINGRGELVGGSEQLALWWPGDGAPVELPDLPDGAGGTALAINDDGVIAGEVFLADGVSHAAVWRRTH